MITQVSPKSKSFDFQARRISIFIFIFQKGFFSMWVKSKGPGKGQKPLKPNQIIFTGLLRTQELIHWKKKKQPQFTTFQDHYEWNPILPPRSTQSTDY